MRSLLKEMDDGNEFQVPSGVRLYRKKGSRACYFECEDDIAKEDLVELLDSKGILWQENE